MHKSEVTLQDLTYAALGASPLTEFNLEILQTLMTHMLRKLEFENVKVRIEGLDATCLKNLLENSKVSELNLYDKKWKLHENMVKKVSSLKDRLNVIDHEVSWEEASHICQLPPEYHPVISSIIGNKMFIKLLDLHIAIPVITEIVNIEDEVYDMTKDFANLMLFSEKVYKKLALLNCLENEMKAIQSTMKQNYLKFLISMEEILDVLELKLHKSQIEELMRELQRHLKQLEAKIEEYKERISCRKGYWQNKLRCVVCSNTEVTADIEPMGGLLLPEMGSVPAVCKPITKKLRIATTTHCERKVTGLLTSYQFIPNINVKIKGQRIMGKKCVGDIVLIEGPEGHFFRKNLF